MEEVVLQTKWGTLVALYLFLGGLAAGTLCVSAVLGLKWKEKFEKTVVFGAWAGTLFLIIGVLFLVAETSMPFRAMMLWQSFTNFSSWMTIGAWLLVLGIATAAIYAIAATVTMRGGKEFWGSLQKILSILIIPISVFIALYTGILLGVLEAHPLWNTWLLPLLFTVSALDTGVALVLGFMIVHEPTRRKIFTKSPDKKPEENDSTNDVDSSTNTSSFDSKTDVETVAKVTNLLEKATIVLVVCELIVLTIFLVMVSGASEVGAISVGLMISGPLAVPFWLLFVACGLVVPLGISVFVVVKHGIAEQQKTLASLAGVALCMAGGCTLRFLILLAGLPVHAGIAGIG